MPKIVINYVHVSPCKKAGWWSAILFLEATELKGIYDECILRVLVLTETYV